MPIEVNWANDEKTIILFQVIGQFNDTEYLEGIEKRKALQDTVSHKSSVVADFSKSNFMPAQAINKLRKAAKIMPHPNFSGILVISGAEGIHLKIAEIFSLVYGKLHFSKTKEEAFKIIENITKKE